jgi:hypothetical protein
MKMAGAILPQEGLRPAAARIFSRDQEGDALDEALK